MFFVRHGIHQGLTLVLSGLMGLGLGQSVMFPAQAQPMLGEPIAVAAPTQLAKQSPSDSIPLVPIAQLPIEAKKTVELIKKGGPFPFPHKDGTVFSNRERRLPAAPRSYYHEYTVPTPRSRDRGARRIVTGQKGEYYYTGDHYRSFVRIKP